MVDKKIIINKQNKNNVEHPDFDVNLKNMPKKIFSFKTGSITQPIKKNFDLDYIIENIDTFSVNQLKKSIKTLAMILKDT